MIGRYIHFFSTWDGQIRHVAAVVRHAMMYTLCAIQRIGRPPAVNAPTILIVRRTIEKTTTLFLLMAVMAATAVWAADKKPAEATKKEAGWVAMFDGKTLAGWSTTTKKQKVEVVDGEIQILSKGANLWLLHEKSYADFELEVEVKMPAGTYNSGIGFRCTSNGKKPKGYQCEVDKKKTGQIYAIGKGWVWPKNADEKKEFAKLAGDCFKDGEWNKIKIYCVGKKIKIWINDTVTADLEDDKFSSGVVALQHHGKGDVHQFRNIRVRELNADGTVKKTEAAK